MAQTATAAVALVMVVVTSLAWAVRLVVGGGTVCLSRGQVGATVLALPRAALSAAGPVGSEPCTVMKRFLFILLVFVWSLYIS